MSEETDEGLRGLAFSLAYRMVGSVADAEDVVQEAYLRLHRARERGEAIASPKAYLTTIVTRLSLDALRSARRRRETYVGPWLPEPLVADAAADAERHVEMADTLSMAMLLVLERLTPAERAVFLLRDVFGYAFGEIAAMLDRSEAGCRQLLVRARRRVAEGRPRFEATPEQREALASRFLAAAHDGDLDGLLELLTADACFVGDGGGKATATSRPVHGARSVARLLLAIFARGARLGGTAQPVLVNGVPGLMTRDRDGRLVSVMALDVADGRIQAVHSVINPDKLGHLGLELSPLARRATAS